MNLSDEIEGTSLIRITKKLSNQSFKSDSFQSVYSKKHVLRSLSFFGLYVLGNSKQCSKWNAIFRIMHTTFFSACLHYWCLFYFSYFLRNEGTWQKFNKMLITWVSTLTYDLFLLNRKKIRLFVEISNFDRTIPLRRNDRQSLVKTTKIVNLLIWIYILCYSLLYLIFPTKIKPEFYFTIVCSRYCFDSGTSQVIGKYMVQLCEAFMCLVVQGSLTFVVIFYIVSLWVSRLWFKGLDRVSYRFLTATDFSKVKNFRKAYDIVIERIHILDDAFSLSVLCWFLTVIIVVCFRVIAILGKIHKDGPLDIQAMLLIGFGLFRGIFIILTSICFSAQWLTDAARNSVLKLEILLESMPNYLVYQEICIVLHNFEVKPPVVTLWYFTPLGKSLLMSCIQIIVTYVIICLQMTPFGNNAIQV